MVRPRAVRRLLRGLVAVWFTLGKIVVNSSAITALDQSVADWFVDQRTPDLDTASEWGSGLADTFVKIGVTALMAIAMRLAWKRWREPLMMVVPLVLEAAAFITVTYLIARPRPEDGLESSPVNSSFPSGHVAAAAAYSALVIIVFWHTRKMWIRALVIVVSVVVPVVVALSRMYRGMHFLSDVIAGAALGVAAVALSWWMIRRAVHRTEGARSNRARLHQTRSKRTRSSDGGLRPARSRRALAARPHRPASSTQPSAAIRRSPGVRRRRGRRRPGRAARRRGVVGWILDTVESNRGFARWDSSIADWGLRTPRTCRRRSSGR